MTLGNGDTFYIYKINRKLLYSRNDDTNEVNLGKKLFLQGLHTVRNALRDGLFLHVCVFKHFWPPAATSGEETSKC